MVLDFSKALTLLARGVTEILIPAKPEKDESMVNLVLRVLWPISKKRIRLAPNERMTLSKLGHREAIRLIGIIS